jgi:hypothetical protein
MRTSALHAGTAEHAAPGDMNAGSLAGREAGYHAFLMLRRSRRVRRGQVLRRPGRLAISLAPWINDVMPAAWLVGIIVNLLTVPGRYDVALRDFGLLLGALTLARLAFAYDSPVRRGGS